MLDVDTVATFMTSIVTDYFATCGDSLEAILDDSKVSHSFRSSTQGKQATGFNQHHSNQAIAYSVDALTHCRSIELESGLQPFETEKINGTDLTFFPLPSSEKSHSKKSMIRKKQSVELKEQGISGYSKCSLGSPLVLRKINNVSTKSVISPPTEVASKWIAMGNKPWDEIKFDETLLATHSSESRCQKRHGAPVNSKALRLLRNMPLNDLHDLQVRTRTPRATEAVETTKSEDKDVPLLSSIIIGNLDASQNNHQHQQNNQKMSSHWKSAEDPRSGQTYYFHEITRETQWRKPLELATDEEKIAMEEKEQKEKDFFAAMEANILSSLSRGVIPGTPAQGRPAAANEEDPRGTSKEERKSSLRRIRSRGDRPKLVRTISTMDETVLTDVILRQPSFRNVKSGLSKREPSFQLDDLKQVLGSRSNNVHDGFESSCSSSEGSHHSSGLETLKEDAGESSSSVALDRGAVIISGDDNGFSLRTSANIVEQSISTRDDLNWKESQALNKLFRYTKEMIDADEERPNNDNEFSKLASIAAGPAIDEKSENVKQEQSGKHPTRTLRRVTEGDIGRTLPRELGFGDPDGDKKKSSSATMPRRARMLANSGKTAADLFKPPEKPKRINTCGTMYIETTMSKPDKDATIRCVCGVYRTHIISAEHANQCTEETESLNVFNDYPNDANGTQNQTPTLDEITKFYRDIFFKAQMEADCIIMSLIYVERLIKKTSGNLRPRASNWRSLVFSCMILSSKVWDDLSMWNADFSQSCPPGGVNFSLQRINQLELAVLNTLKFNVKVPASEYAKYYFLLRSMLIKSGLGGKNLGSLDPLDVDGARRLQQVSSQFEMNNPSSQAFQRSKSLAVEQNSKSIGHPKGKVGLEQVVKM